MKGSRGMLAGVGVYALLAAVSVEAQTASPVDEQATADRGQLADIVVTARRVTEKLQDVPIAVTALSGNDLVRQSVKEFRDVGATIPNVRFEQSNASADSVNIQVRGQSQSDVLLTTDSSVGLYFDNVALPRLYGLRSSFVDMERVEVLRGPQGTLYGRNTTGGAVSIFSKDPTDEIGASVSLGYGNYDAKEVIGILNVPLSEGLAARVVGNLRSHDGYGRDGAGREVADENSKYIRGKLKFESGRFSANLMADYTNYRDGGPMGALSAIMPADAAAGMPPGGLATLELALQLQGALTPEAIGQAIGLLTQYSTTSPDGNFYNVWGAQPQLTNYKGWRTALNMDYELSDDLLVKSITGYSGFRRRSLYEPDATPFPIGTTDTRIRQKFFSQELQLQGNSGPLEWVVGGYYSREHGFDFTINDYLPFLAGGLRGIQDGEVTNKSIAGFAQATYAVSDTVNITGGARYTKETKAIVTQNHQILGGATICSVPGTILVGSCLGKVSNNFSKPSWLISADWKPVQDILLYAKVSRGFRGGGQNLRGTTVDTFTPFKPETATEYEIGAKTELLDRRLRLNVALWRDNYRNIQRSIFVLNPVSGSTDTLVTNAAAATLQGFEAEATLRATEGLTLNGSLGYFHAKYKSFVDFTGDRTGEDWPLTPDWTYSLSARYELPTSFGTASAQFDWAWRSKVNLDPSARFPGAEVQESFGLLNGRIAAQIDSLGSEVSLFGRNLLKKKYNVSGLALESLGFDFINRGMPRTYGIQFVARFGGER